MKKIFLLFLLQFSFLLSKSQDTVRVLFLGNSYTFVNDLPNTFRMLGNAAGKVIEVDSNTPGGYTFAQHVTNGTSLGKIALGNWDYVVLQEQSQMPSFPPFQVQSDVYPYAKKLDSLIHVTDSCTKTVFFMTWGRKYGDASNCGNYSPLCTFEGMQMRLRSSYLEMAQSNYSMVAPVGMAWRSSRLSDSTINLWSSDFSHPSLEGTYLAACTFFSTIFRQSTLGINYTAGLNSNSALFLQQMADSTVLDSLSNWISYFDPSADTLIGYDLDSSDAMTIHFNGITTNTHAVFWDFGDETFSYELNPSHTFPNPGIFEITKVVQSPYCGTDTVKMILPIENVGIQKTRLPFGFVFSDRSLTWNESADVEIWNGVGERILVVSKQTSPLDLSNLPIGLYTIQISNGKHSFIKKLVLN